jgi:subfamily B ATP-binding cassette protein MsbA
MVVAGLLVMTVAAINLALLRLAGVLWDVITVQHDAARMNELIVWFLGLVIIQGLCAMGHSYLTAWVSQHIVADFRRHVFAHLQTLSVGFFARRRTGELLSRLMNDVTVIQSVVTETPIDGAKQLVTFVGGIAFLLAMNWRLCLLILILLPMLVFVAKFFGRQLKSLSTSIQDQTAALSTLIEEVIAGIRVVKSFVQTRREETRFSSQINQTLSLTMRRRHGRIHSRHQSAHIFRRSGRLVVRRTPGHRWVRVARRVVRLCALRRHSHRTLQFGRPSVRSDSRGTRSHRPYL